MVAIVVVAGIAVRWQFVHEKSLDDDELQHVHFAWCITEGMVPYRDFWDNHPPALHYILAPIISRVGPSSASVAVCRTVMFFVGLAAFAATFLLGSAAFDKRTAALGVMWLACSELFLLKSVEIRPDGILAALIVLGLGMLACAMRSARPPTRTPGDPGSCTADPIARKGREGGWLYMAITFGAGLAFGSALIFSTKAVIVIALALPLYAGLTFRRASPWLRRWITRLCTLVLGLAIPPAIWVAFEASNGALGAALQFTVLQNITLPDRFNPWCTFHEAGGLGLLIVSLAGVALVCLDCASARSLRRPSVLVVVPAVGLGLIYFFVMPAPYVQSATMFLPLAAILAGYLTARASDLAARATSAPSSRAVGWLAVLACVWLGAVHPLWRIQARRGDERTYLAAQLELMDLIHERTSPNDVVFDGRSLATFRRHALFRPVLVQGVLARYRMGHISPGIRRELRENRCTLVFRDSRSERIPPEDWAFIETHFIHAGQWDWSYLPGRTFQADALEDEGARFDVIVAGDYLLKRDNPESTTIIDGNTAIDSARLDEGTHTIRSTGPPSALTIWRPAGQ